MIYAKFGKILPVSAMFVVFACGQLPLDQTTAESLGLSSGSQESLANLGLAEDGTDAEVEESSHARKEGLVDQLSAEAKTIFEQVKQALENIRDEKEKICAHDSELRRSIGDQLKAIHDDTSLSRSEKHAKMEELLAAHQEELEADQAAFQQCVVDHASELQVWKDKAEALVSACGMPRKAGGQGKPKHGGPLGEGPESHKFGHGPKGPGDREDGAAPAGPEISVESLEASLKSEECSNSLSLP